MDDLGDLVGGFGIGLWALSFWFLSVFLSAFLSFYLSFFIHRAGDGGPYSDEVRHLLGILRPGKIGAEEGRKGGRLDQSNMKHRDRN